MKILVTGANGQLGSELRRLAATSAHDFIFTDVAELDITDADAVEAMMAAEGVEAVINCAAYTNVDAAEDHEALAELLNGTAPGILADAVRRHDAWLFHVSTDYVFGRTEANTPRDENQQANPSGVYGLTKLHGEQAIERSGCRYIIIRTAWLYSEFGKNFVKTIGGLLRQGRDLNVVFDQVGTPTYALDLAKAILAIIDRGLDPDLQGIYNYTDEGVCSWYDFAQAIRRELADMPGSVSPCHSDEFPSKVKRPFFSVLDKTKIKTTFGLEIPYWTDSLHACMQTLEL